MPKIIENVKEKLILEGRNTLIEKNYKELNIRDIAQSCHIAIGTFYNYFPNKEEFVSEIFRDDWRNTLILAEKLKETEEPLRDKIKKVYLSMQDFVDRYISIFYEIAMLKGYESKRDYHMKDIFIKMEEILTIEKTKGNVKSPLSPEKLAHFVISNLMNLNKNKYMSFEELYEQMNL